MMCPTEGDSCVRCGTMTLVQKFRHLILLNVLARRVGAVPVEAPVPVVVCQCAIVVERGRGHHASVGDVGSME